MCKCDVVWPPSGTVTTEEWRRQSQMWPGGLMPPLRTGRTVWVRLPLRIFPLISHSLYLQFPSMCLKGPDLIFWLMLFQMFPSRWWQRLKLPQLWIFIIHDGSCYINAYSFYNDVPSSLQICPTASSYPSRMVCSRSWGVSRTTSALSRWLTTRWRPFPASSSQPSLSWEVVNDTRNSWTRSSRKHCFDICRWSD